MHYVRAGSNPVQGTKGKVDCGSDSLFLFPSTLSLVYSLTFLFAVVRVIVLNVGDLASRVFVGQF